MDRRELKTRVRKALRGRGVEVGGYRHTVHARRAALLDAHGVDLLVDVGANVGQYASSVREAGYGRRVLSVEPVSAAFDELARVAEEDASWDVVHVALGEATGELTMNVSEGSIFSSPLQVLDSTRRASPDARVVRTEVVPVTTLDLLLADTQADSLAVKIDVQGFEREVLRGATRTLSRARLLELEFSPRPVYEGQMLMLETLERLDAAGFVLALVENLFPDPVTGASLQFNGVFARSR